MRKEDVVFVVGLLRKTVQERRKMTISDAQVIVNRLNLLYNSDVLKYKEEIESYIDMKINYFIRKNNKSKENEYLKIRKRNSAFFEFFLENKEKFIPKSQ